MYTSIKTHIKLTANQEILLAKHVSFAKYTDNCGLAIWSQLYKSNSLLLNKFFNNEVKPNTLGIPKKECSKKLIKVGTDA
ncbi:helix-turn-helix domain-containing protein [Nostoc sp. B(2019)]|nr:helix-turn-helix domain-containing protein [Nostoc sp. B(2019)]